MLGVHSRHGVRDGALERYCLALVHEAWKGGSLVIIVTFLLVTTISGVSIFATVVTVVTIGLP